MKTIKIQIPDMQSSHCQMRVSNAIKTIEGTSVAAIGAGWAEVELETTEQQKAVTSAIEKAGYTITGIDTHIAGTSETGNTFQFKTNINCSGCVAKVTTQFQNITGIADWKVDTMSADKTLTIHSDGITENEVIKAVQNAGFKIEQIAIK